jgi:hypothetical protein
LTKIIVGLGLTQIRKIGPVLRALAEYLASGFKGGEIAANLALVILIYFSIGGFLSSYLWNRLHLAESLRRTEAGATAEQVERALTDQKAPRTAS